MNASRLPSIIVGIGALVLSWQYYAESRAYLAGSNIGSASTGIYTQMLAYSMALCGILLLVRTVLLAPPQKAPVPFKVLRFLALLIFSACYIWSLPYLGYIIASTAIGAALLLMMREKNPIRIVLFPLLYALAIYTLFVKGLLISLPSPDIFS